MLLPELRLLLPELVPIDELEPVEPVEPLDDELPFWLGLGTSLPVAGVRLPMPPKLDSASSEAPPRMLPCAEDPRDVSVPRDVSDPIDELEPVPLAAIETPKTLAVLLSSCPLTERFCACWN